MVISSWSRQLSVSEHMGRPAASPRAAATTSRGVATPITRLRRLRARPHSEELEEVVGQTDQRPLGGDFVIAAEGEAPKGAALLRLTKDRLDDRLADRKSTRLNSSHGYISYAVFCLKKKKKHRQKPITSGQPTKRLASLSVAEVQPCY